MTAFRAYHDNVLLRLHPRERTTAGGVVIPGFEYVTENGRNDAQKSRDPRIKTTAVRWATVLAVGPGHVPGCRKCGGERKGAFIPTQLVVGDRVLVGEMSGYDYTLDVRGLRQRDKTEAFDSVADEDGEMRVVREDEVMGYDEDVRAQVEAREVDALAQRLWFVNFSESDRLVPRWPAEDSGVE